MMRDDLPHGAESRDWRLDRLEQDLRDTRLEMRDTLRGVNSSADKIQAQLNTLQIQIPSQFVSRADLIERETITTRRLDRTDALWNRTLFALVGLAFAVIIDFVSHILAVPH